MRIIFDNSRNPKIKEAAEYWDKKGLIANCVVEESAELIQAVNKFERWRLAYPDERANTNVGPLTDNVISEIGDVLIAIDMYLHIYGYDEGCILNYMKNKLDQKKEV